MRRNLGIAIALMLLWPAAAGAATLAPYGHTCELQESGVRFCPTTGLTDRVPSWDGALLDADVTLPATGDGPFPTIAMLHGYLDTKATFELGNGGGGGGVHYNNVWYAKRGYAYINYTVRGANNSCGQPQARLGYPACDRAWFRLGDQRYDARDAQHLLGELVDEGIADPKALGATGQSLGSLASIELAVLHNRIRLPDGRFARWTSPKGTPLTLGAVFTTQSISSLAELIAPNGRLMDGEVPAPDQDRTPLGVPLEGFPAAAVATVPLSYLAPPGEGADVAQGIATGLVAPPGSPAISAALAEFATYHQGFGMPVGRRMTPLLIGGGWADDIVQGASQEVRIYNLLRAQIRNAPVSLVLSNVGHARAVNPTADQTVVFDTATAFFDRHLRHTGRAIAPGAVKALTVGCPNGTKFEGPFVARDWGALARGAVRFGAAPAQDVSPLGGDAALGLQVDPVVNGQIQGGRGGACDAFGSRDAPGTAVVATEPLKTSFIMLGRPTLTMDVTETGDWGQLDARLWDVAPDGTQILVTRGNYSLTPGQSGTITWQLNGSGYRFAAGHRARLELLGADPSYYRPYGPTFTLSVGDVSVELPTREAPDGGEIVAPTVNHRAPTAASINALQAARAVGAATGRTL